MIALYSVMAHHQPPPGETAFEFLYAIARSRLSGLHKQSLKAGLETQTQFAGRLGLFT
jgi:hypothetical protein